MKKIIYDYFFAQYNCHNLKIYCLLNLINLEFILFNIISFYSTMQFLLCKKKSWI